MYIQDVWIWSIISEIDANPKKIKPKAIFFLSFILFNLLKDLIPKIIGIIAAWRWANNKIKKNKINSQNQLI